jgi:DNA-binding TFAR19-related protein (PDSD5 family)
MSNEEAIKRLNEILTEATEFKTSVCYVTEEEREPLEMAIKALDQQARIAKIIDDCDLEAWEVLEMIKEVVKE